MEGGQTIVYGEEDMFVTKKSALPYVEATEEALDCSYRSFEIANATMFPIEGLSTDCYLNNWEIKKMLKVIKESQKGTRVEDEIDDVVDFEVINLGTQEEVKEVRIGTLALEQDQSDLVTLLHEFKDIFTWSYQDMLGLYTEIIIHRLPLKPELAKYPNWVTNIVPVTNKDGKEVSFIVRREGLKVDPEKIKGDSGLKATKNTKGVKDGSMGCVLRQCDSSGKKEQAVYYLSKKFTNYESKKATKGSVIADCLAELPIEDYEPKKFDFSDEDIMG
ncbi:uncharacterized protein E6C27_scaffold34G00430 [Cucumis melo var. makuwa]|uniref:Uncharacterized protein n=1 Tax=Cucumis melo var. makuwa TaxID=1194695 RepID=A0A5A7SJE2_CUCMM|nr:uncharacterized protein E6C27_scaffold34G00430 [Cucumis melo var. makuwa]